MEGGGGELWGRECVGFDEMLGRTDSRQCFGVAFRSFSDCRWRRARTISSVEGDLEEKADMAWMVGGWTADGQTDHRAKEWLI